jgi:hypothetical protein
VVALKMNAPLQLAWVRLRNFFLIEMKISAMKVDRGMFALQ